MVQNGLFVRIEAASGKEDELAQFLTGAQSLVEQEAGTVVWFAVRFDASTFGIFDAFEDESGRDAHLNGAVAQALGEHPELFATPPNIEQVDVLASKGA
jgi:quinol monooxygenase YgiN